MARKTTAALLAEIQALFPDNNTELITPAAIRTSLTNICESFTDAYGALRGLPGVAQTISSVVSKLAIFDTVVVSAPTVTPSAANDNVVVGYGAGYRFEFTTTVTGTNNAIVRFVARVNGVESVWTFQVTLSGPATNAEVSFSGFVSMAIGDVFDMGVSSLTGTFTPTFSDSYLLINDVQQ